MNERYLSSNGDKLLNSKSFGSRCREQETRPHKYNFVISIFLLILCGWAAKVVAIPKLYGYEVSFAGAGGDFNSRTASFTVPEANTTISFADGLRLYEAHLAKIIELTDYFCQERSPEYVIYWNYEADEGRVFMGEFLLSCQKARETFQTFGSNANEEVTIDYSGNPIQETIATLALDENNSQEFAALVQTIKPQCIDTIPKICPGDRYW